MTMFAEIAEPSWGFTVRMVAFFMLIAFIVWAENRSPRT